MADTPIPLPPSIDPAHRQSVYGTVKFIVDKMVKQDMDNMMPARIVAVDRTTNRATVEIMVSMVTTARQTIKRAQVASVPIYQPSAGGYVVNFPVKVGDLGWLKTTDTDMSLFLQSLNSTPTVQPPNTYITHKFDSSMFFPDEMNVDVVIAGEDSEDLVIQKNDNTVRIAIKEDKVKITAPELVVVASDKITLDTPLTEITGQLISGTESGGSAQFGGTINAVGDITTQVGNISLGTHRHTGVDPGPGNSGGPIT